MFLLGGSLSYDLLEIFIAFSICLIAYYKWAFSYWKRKGLDIPYAPTIPIGHLGDLVARKCCYGEAFKKYYDIFKARGQKHGGIYMLATPVYIALDPEIIKHIMQTDFQHFVNHGTYMNHKADPLSVNLFALENESWKNMRAKLSPTFTSGKMKMMLETMIATTPGLVTIMDDCAMTESPLQLKEIFARFTTDVIGSCAFGIECNSLKDPNDVFRRHGKMAVEEISLVDNFKMIGQLFIPHSILKLFNVKINKSQVEKFFIQAVTKTVDYREKNNVYRKDFMHLLLQLKNRGKVGDDEKIKTGENAEPHLTMDEIAAQCFLFFLAGFETSSTASTFALYELAKNQDMQQKLREDIQSVLKKHDGKMTYEALMEMSYLEKVIHESLRKYPPLPTMFRVCNETYQVPGTDVILEKGTRVQVPVIGIHHDPEYYPDPEKFDPERFNEENKSKRPQFTWIPFGDGPRICIGLRFGMMQSRVGIATIVKDYKITVNKKTREPIKMEINGFIPAVQGGIWLDVEKISC